MLDHRIFFDVEGPLVNPAFDYAWYYVERHAPDWAERLRRFDDYDDLRWENERDEQGHSTGTTPLMALIVAALNGAEDESMVSEIEDNLQLTEGVEPLMGTLSELGIEVHLVTSSYAGVPITVAERFSLPFSRVRCMGFQPQREDDMGGKTKLDEVRARSPLKKLASEPGLVEGFLHDYLAYCDAYLKSSKNPPEDAPSENECFMALDGTDAGEVLFDLLYMEEGIMGAHNKQLYVASTSPDPMYTIYVGDGIVDADSLAYAGWGIAVNCTNTDALRACNVAVATPTMDALTPLINAITSESCDPECPQGSVGKEAKAWGMADLQGDLDDVVREMLHVKNEMKAKYAAGG